jgi:hypothetical protein
MSIQTAEQSLAKFHLLHLVVGLILAVILLAIPKLGVVIVALLLVSLFLPEAISPEFSNKWFDRAAVLLGGIIAWTIFHFLHKL